MNRNFSRYYLLLVILAGCFACKAFAAGPYNGPIPGEYELLLIAVDSDELIVSGYYENYTGWDESTNAPRFSCIFYLTGTINPGESSYKIKTWFPGDRDPDWMIPGELIMSKDKGTLSVHLKEEHGGCHNVQRFGGAEAPQFSLGQKADWLDIRVASAERVYFYSEPDEKSRMRAYVVTGDALKISKKKDGWLYAEYKNDAGKVTKGWVRESELFSNKPPA